MNSQLQESNKNNSQLNNNINNRSTTSVNNNIINTKTNKGIIANKNNSATFPQSPNTSEAGRPGVNNQYYGYNYYSHSQYQQYHSPQYQQQQQQQLPQHSPHQSYYPHQYPQQQPQYQQHLGYYQQQHHQQQQINNSYPSHQQQQNLSKQEQQLQYYGHSPHSSLGELQEQQYNVNLHVQHTPQQQQQLPPQAESQLQQVQPVEQHQQVQQQLELQQDPQKQHVVEERRQQVQTVGQQQEQVEQQSVVENREEREQIQPPAQQPVRKKSVEGIQCWLCASVLQDVAEFRKHFSSYHPHALPHYCRLCPAIFSSQEAVNNHVSECHVVGEAVQSPKPQENKSQSRSNSPAPRDENEEPKKKKKRVRAPKPKGKENKRSDLWCIPCCISDFNSEREFEAHHLVHTRERIPRVQVKRLTPAQIWQAEAKVDSGGKGFKAIKLKLKISKVGRGRGRKRREVKIVGEEGMSDGQDSLPAEEGSQASGEGEEEAAAAGGETREESGGDSGEEREAGRSSADLQDLDERQREEEVSGGNDDEDSRCQDDYQPQGSDSNFPQQNEEEEASPAQREGGEDYQENREEREDGSEGSNSGYNTGFGFNESEGGEGENQNYQTQFESFPSSDWFNEYESGPRIAAAMAGTTAAENAGEEGGAWPEGGERTDNQSYPSASTPPEKGEEDDHPVNGGQSESDREDGLFSQAVLGQESPDKGDRQGSFEQLCLNDSFSGRTEAEEDDGSSQDQDRSQLSSPQEQQQQQQQGSGVANDLLSELEYLNNSGQAQGSQDSQPGSQAGSQSGRTDGSPHSGGPSPHSAGPATPSHLSSRGSNSGTPTSSGGHPTPPPSDTSFRALATSPLTSPTQQPSTSPSLHKGPTPPATSPQQGMSHSPQPGAEGQSGTGPRLTIANNLMASTTSGHPLAATTTTSQAGVGMMGRYGSQWTQGSGYSGSGSYPTMPGTSMANSNMGGPLRPPMPPGVAMPYRPSPPPRVRGRPPLMGHVGRPPLHQAQHMQSSRGPGRPPNSSILPPPLMPAPGGRGSMMPPLQRMHQSMYPQRAGAPQQQAPGAKRPMMGAGAQHSPSKTARREDINVPSRQKDNECQIIAVANRSDGLPVISNVQGGSASASRGPPVGSAPSSTESTINLSDSITLSVRASGSNKEGPGRGERGGPEAGAVANLLASRGITVTPAAGERQDGGSSRDDRRLPTAQELNLSSAISVHPPTQRDREGGGREGRDGRDGREGRERDRDGFAVPQAPPTRSSASNSSSSSGSSSSSSSNVERPPRPPTVDLTQDMPSSGSTNRHKCHQCDRSFPSAGLLADHGRVHQQQQQSRMPFKCHLCTAGFSTQKGQQHHYQQFHQLHLAAGDVAIPLVDLRNPVNVQRMAALGIRSFLPLTNLQNRGAGGVVGVPILTLENLRNGHMTLQQWGVSDVLSLGPAKTLNMPR